MPHYKNQITRNHVQNGGGVHCDAAAAQILDNQIQNNDGEGICLWGCIAATVSGNVISDHRNATHGGIIATSSYLTTIRNNIIYGNGWNIPIMTIAGGGILWWRGSGTISGNLILANGAPSGGGIDASGDTEADCVS